MKAQTIRLAVCLSMVAVLLVAGLSAFSSGRLSANIPFAFFAADRLLPAGDYLISSLDGGRAIKIQSRESADFALALTVPNSSIGKMTGNSLTFYRYGSQNFLRAIQSDDVSVGGALLKSSKEKELSVTHAKTGSDKRLAGATKIVIRLNGE